MSAVLVAAALRWTDPRASAHPLTGTAPSAPYAAGASPADRCALEHALRLAERLGGRCLAVTVGAVGAEEMLREALAAGADEALRVDGPDGDESATARSLLAGLTARGPLPEVVVCGDRSPDRGTGATPAHLAGLLGAAQALGLTELAVGTESAAGVGLRAVRRLDGGRAEELRVPLPAVCSVQPGTVRPRRAPLTGVLAARRAEITVVRADVREAATVRAGRPRPHRPRPRALTAPEGGTRQRLLALTGALVPPRTPPRVVTPASPEEAAELLLAELRRHGVDIPARPA
ncbi:mycofactocin-associated electron transfer flavoprotein beta subunit [Streptomyces sp. NPDC001817]|uniref:mycofactocin-associated electron transfer flavoprotein beta subunit n=1 Tax=Streptomyces sp. NPDC001817 TaxID=3154398 RepID=UPI00331AB5E7